MIATNGSYLLDSYVDVSINPPPTYDTVEDVVGILDAKYEGQLDTWQNRHALLCDWDSMIYNLRARGILASEEYTGQWEGDELTVARITTNLQDWLNSFDG
jgi:hypothetical protein